MFDNIYIIAMDTITHTEIEETQKLTLFGTIAKAYNNLCDNAKRITGDINCSIKGNMESIKTYINREIANEDERKFLTEKANEYSKSIQEITKDVKDTTMKTASTMKKRAYAPEDPREALHALYVLEERITNVINETLEVPSIDVETMKNLLELDTTLYENKLNKLIELIFNLYNKNVLGNEDDIVSVSKAQKLLFIGYLFCESLPQDASGKNLEESPIPYNVLLETKDMSDEEINAEFNRICKFEKEANVEDKPQQPATTVFERIEQDDGVATLRPMKKPKTDGGKKTNKKRTRNNKKKHGKTQKKKRSSKKKPHKKK